MRVRARDMRPEGTMSLREAAKELGITEGTLRNLRADGLITVVSTPERRGQPVLIHEDEVARVRAWYTPTAGGKVSRRQLAGVQ